MEEKKKAELKLMSMEEIQAEEVEWLLYPFIPYGKVTIVQGDPGEGKTTMMLQIIARLTKGEAVLSEWEQTDNTEETKPPMTVLYQTAEDGLGDTIKPRLMAAGADCNKVIVIDDREKALTLMDERLEEAIARTSARLVVLDPIQGYLGAEVDMNRANEIRPVMKKLLCWRKNIVALLF